MFLRRSILFPALILALASSSAGAFFDPPWITPAVPGEGDLVSVNIHGGICDAILEHAGYPIITQTGNSIRILEYGVHVDSVDWCIYGEGTLTVPIGSFDAGDYTLIVDFTYPDLVGPTTTTLGIIPFTVAGIEPATPVPASSTFQACALSSLILSAALWSLRRRRRNQF